MMQVTTTDCCEVACYEPATRRFRIESKDEDVSFLYCDEHAPDITYLMCRDCGRRTKVLYDTQDPDMKAVCKPCVDYVRKEQRAR